MNLVNRIKLVQIYQYSLSVQLHRKSRQYESGMLGAVAVTQVKAVAVSRAVKSAILNYCSSQRTSLMRAFILDGINGPFEVYQQDLFA